MPHAHAICSMRTTYRLLSSTPALHTPALHTPWPRGQAEAARDEGSQQEAEAARKRAEARKRKWYYVG
eukprot:2216669-Prymnesium_polylepis.1